MFKYLFFLLILAGIFGYYEFGLIKQIQFSVAKTSFAQNSGGGINISVEYNVTNPSDLAFTVTALNGIILVGTTQIGTFTIPASTVIAAKGSTLIPITVTIPSNVMTWANLLGLATSSITFQISTSGKVWSIPVYNEGFSYVTNLATLLTPTP